MISTMIDILALLAGTLCVLSNGKLTNCTPTTEALIKLQPAVEARRLVWTSDDGKRLAMAMVPVSAETLDLGKLRDVTLHVSGDPTRRWPADVRIGFGRDGVVTVPAKSVAKLTTISLPPARYALTFQAEHHATATRNIDLASNERVDAGEVRLRPLPLLTGTVVTPKEGKDVPLSGADLSFSAPKLRVPPHLATTDDKGVFRAELPEGAPDVVVVSYAGLGSKTISLDRRGSDANLGTIRLLPGVVLTVKVVRPTELRAKPLNVTLYRRDQGFYEPTHVAARELATTADEVTFDNLAPAEHTVIVEGNGPLERIDVPVTVEEGKPAAVEVRIEPYTLTGRVTFGGDPLDNAKVEVSPNGQIWRAPLTSSADGSFGGTAWQHGKLHGSVLDARLGTVYFSDSPELGADPSVWNIDIKKRTISGRVYDAETKAPFARAELTEAAVLLADNRQIPYRGNVHADEDGNFTILAAWPGRYELRFAPADYVPKRIILEIADEDGAKQADLAMEHGTKQALMLRWPDGAPIANATIYDGNAPEPGGLPPTYRSDAAGAAAIRGTKGEVHTLYVLPVEGSIAVVHLPIGDSDAKPVDAVVGRPAGALRVVGVDPDGKPALGAIVLRYNGDFIPPDIVMRRYGGPSEAPGERLLDRLPAGMYEVWVSRQWTLPTEPAMAKVGISTGEERVQITVPKR